VSPNKCDTDEQPEIAMLPPNGTVANIFGTVAGSRKSGVFDHGELKDSGNA